MKNLCLALSITAIVGWSGATLAQTSESISVGTPDSNNTLLIQQDYQATITEPVVNPNDASKTDWSQEGNVDVAPIPTPDLSAPAPENSSMTIDESVIENNGLGATELQMNESVAN